MPAAPRLGRPGRSRSCRAQGLSLVESLVALAVLAIVAGAALPAFTALAEQRHLQGVAAQFEADVQFARDSAELRAQSVRLTFFDGADGPRCWLVHTGEPEACRCDAVTGSAACDAPSELLRASVLPGTVPLRLAPNAASVRFSAPRHTVSPALTLTLSARSGRSVSEVVSVVGRVRGCAPAGAVPGFRSC
ncbi:GspH/FimT family pseudopilin [Azohydromonas caseinilytica]|uniref:Type II secretion system protein H n=1 Tax=Azohydromonas caseinilytica TaxID=2728836 RepID=A0A848F7L8_9BURK|nr:GspH/FimT family pseudopilin [Azohydromonas caseinilytica]NML14715.1 prepilin-type N-terminal cleavage/methylation domain-containing protein [Azohydromonas caseinilytica]